MTALVASNRAGDFRCVLAELPWERDREAPLVSAARAVLGVVHGDPVRCVLLHRRMTEGSVAPDEDDADAHDAHDAQPRGPATHLSGARR
jgi:arginine N-succinyltransferase